MPSANAQGEKAGASKHHNLFRRDIRFDGSRWQRQCRCECRKLKGSDVLTRIIRGIPNKN